MKRVALHTATVLLIAACFPNLLTSCFPRAETSSSKLESQMSSSTDESSSSNISGSLQDTDTKYKKIQLELPDDLTDVPTKQFDDLVQISTPHIFSIGEDYFSYAVETTFYRDDPDLKVYKCDISSGEAVELAGIMPNWNSSSGRYAVCGDNVYMFYETLKDRILVNLDFHDNKVDVLKKR